MPPSFQSLAGRMVLCACAAFMAACAMPPPPPPPPPAGPSPVVAELTRERERADQLEREVKRLHADLDEAENSLIAIESGLIGGEHTRAEAVSSLADSRILVERAADATPWRRGSVREARRKLEEADRHIGAGNFGSALFFTSRARRIAETLIEESENAVSRSGVLFVTGRRVNVRAGPSTDHDVIEVVVRRTPVLVETSQDPWIQVRTPSGNLGWIHGPLLAGDSPS